MNGVEVLDLTDSRAYNLQRLAMGDEMPDEMWMFDRCIVVQGGDRFGCIVGAFDGVRSYAFATPLVPRESVEDFRAKLDDGADPMEYDIAECGVVDLSKCEVMGVEVGGCI